MQSLCRSVIFLLCFSQHSWGALVTFQLKDNQGDPLPHAIISLFPLTEGAIQLAANSTPQSATLSQSNKQFTPHVVAVKKGATVTFPNQDSIKHQVYSLSEAQPFDLTIEAGETETGPTMSAAGAIHIGCNIHDWMQAYVYVTDTPWFAVSDSNGAVTIEVPDNEQFRWQLWHARLSQLEPVHQGELLTPSAPVSVQLQTALLPGYDEASDLDDFDDY